MTEQLNTIVKLVEVLAKLQDKNSNKTPAAVVIYSDGSARLFSSTKNCEFRSYAFGWRIEDIRKLEVVHPTKEELVLPRTDSDALRLEL